MSKSTVLFALIESKTNKGTELEQVKILTKKKKKKKKKKMCQVKTKSASTVINLSVITVTKFSKMPRQFA